MKLWTRGTPDIKRAWALYTRAREFKEAIDLYDTVESNENFFIGKQWEGVNAAGLPTPVFNILKRDVLHVVASITTDNLSVKASPLENTPDTKRLGDVSRILSEEFAALMEQNHLVETIREFARDAAVRGDGCLYSYWDSALGSVRTETLPNTQVHFGNPNDRRVQTQPYLIIERRDIAEDVREEAKNNGCADFERIVSDEEDSHLRAEKRTGDKVTRLLFLWKENGSVWAYECTKNCEVRAKWDLGLRRYPIVWLNWDYVSDCCHGQSMLTGLIPNQIFINRMWALSMLSMMTTAYPKVIYDRSKISKWSNRVGEAIGVTGGDLQNVARILDPAAISPQVGGFIEMAVEQTNRTLGANAAALGDVRPDNTSAIVALQRAAATPSEITKQNLRRCVEELAWIWLEFIAEYYGVRDIDLPATEEILRAAEFAKLPAPETVRAPFDFGVFKALPLSLKIEAGASAYYSEIAAIQTLDNLLRSGAISVTQYLARLPDGYVPDRQGLIEEIAGQKTASFVSVR